MSRDLADEPYDPALHLTSAAEQWDDYPGSSEEEELALPAGVAPGGIVHAQQRMAGGAAVARNRMMGDDGCGLASDGALHGADEQWDGYSTGSSAEDQPPAELLAAAAALGRRARSLRVAASLCYFNAFFGMGLLLANLGPILPQIEARTGVGLGAIGFLVASRSAGYLAGCAVAGAAYDAAPARGHAMLAAAVAGAAALNAAVALCYSGASMGLALAAQGVAIGFLDTGCNVMIVRQHGRATVGPWMQSLHLFFGFGALAAPLSLAWTMGAGATPGTSFDAAFFGTAVYMAATSLPLLLLRAPPALEAAGSSADSGGGGGAAGASTAKNRSPQAAAAAAAGLEVGGGNSSSSSSSNSQQQQPLLLVASRYRRAVILLLGAFLFCYVGAEVNYGAYVLAYAQAEQGATQHAGQRLTAAYWAALALGRLGGVAASVAGVAPALLLALNSAGCIGCTLAMALAPRSGAVLWAGTIGFGLSMASQFPSALSLAARYVSISGKDQGTVNVLACSGEIVLPVLVSQLFERCGALTFAQGNVGLAVATLGAFLALRHYGEEGLRRRAEGGPDEGTPLLLPPPGAQQQQQQQQQQQRQAGGGGGAWPAAEVATAGSIN